MRRAEAWLVTMPSATQRPLVARGAARSMPDAQRRWRALLQLLCMLAAAVRVTRAQPLPGYLVVQDVNFIGYDLLQGGTTTSGPAACAAVCNGLVIYSGCVGFVYSPINSTAGLCFPKSALAGGYSYTGLRSYLMAPAGWVGSYGCASAAVAACLRGADATCATVLQF